MWSSSDRPEDEFFAEGIHDDLLTIIAKIGSLIRCCDLFPAKTVFVSPWLTLRRPLKKLQIMLLLYYAALIKSACLVI